MTVPPSPGRPWLVLLIPLVPTVAIAGLESPARADRFAIGASIGSSKDEGGTPSLPTRGVLARIKLSGKLSLEGTLDGAKSSEYAQRNYKPSKGLRAMAAARYDLGTGALAPYLVAAVGAERWTTDWMEFGYWRREVGVGLDVRISDGLHLGADIRTGVREFIGKRQTENVAIDVYIPEPFSEHPTDYVTTRLTLTASF